MKKRGCLLCKWLRFTKGWLSKKTDKKLVKGKWVEIQKIKDTAKVCCDAEMFEQKYKVRTGNSTIFTKSHRAEKLNEGCKLFESVGA